MTPSRPSLLHGRRLLGAGLVLVAALATTLVVALAAGQVPVALRQAGRLLPHDRLVEINGLRFGYDVTRDVRLPMPDGVELAASLYLPRGDDKRAAVLVRLPYGRLAYGEGLNIAERFARDGYAVLVEDLRGTHGSGGEALPYRAGVTDGAATLDWIVAQPWSNGRVGTIGCSALGESQYVLARAHHPALRAMVPLGAGGAVGSAAGRYGYFGVFEGGVFQLASGFGWFVENGATDPRAPAAAPFDVGQALAGLPVADLVQRARPGPNGYDDFMRRPLADPSWHDLGYLDDADAPDVPVLEITTWGDQTVGDTLALDTALRARAERAGGGPERHLLIAPGTHCHAEETAESRRFGEVDAANASQPYAEFVQRWFDHWLRDRGEGLAALPGVRYYMMGEQRRFDAPRWPPPESVVQRWYLGSGGRANTAAGDGWLAPMVAGRVAGPLPGASAGQGGFDVLRRHAPPMAPLDEFVYDPMHPVPSRGGPICCTGLVDEPSGPTDQREVERRGDVLVYTSAPLRAPLRVAGPLRAVLTVSSSAADTDFVARLVDVDADGRAISMQEGVLRARYRAGIGSPRLLEPDRPVKLTIDMRAIAWRLEAGHRLRLDVTSSSFPRLERNLNTGGDNLRESRGVVARNRVHHGAATLSYLELPVLPTID